MLYINSDKIEKIKLTKDDLYILSDFDRTLTKGGSISAWRVLHETHLLGDNFPIMYDKIHDITVIDKSFTDDENSKLFEDRFKDYMRLLQECNFNKEIARQAAKKTKLQLRDGAKEFLKEMANLKIPVIIISCSIKNIIEEYLKIQGCYYDNIYIFSNVYEKEIEKCIYNVTPYNKSKIAISSELNNIIKNRNKAFLFGDIIDDIRMAKDIDNTITVGFLDKHIEENLEEYKKAFDIVLTNQESFSELKKYMYNN